MSGVLNKILTSDAVQLAGTIPGTTYSCINILVTNPTATDATMAIWIGTGSTPQAVDVVEPKVIIPAYGRYEQTARICSANENIFIKATAGCIARIETIEEIVQ